MSEGEAGPPRLFDPDLRAQRRARFAARFAEHDILHGYAAGLVAERLMDVNRSFARVRITGDAGALLQRAGFALPVADTDRLTIRYAEPLRLLADLRGAGESNVLTARRRAFLKRATLMRALQLYRERFAEPDGRVPATFQFLTMTGWRPHESQQKPLKPGSGAISLTEALKPRG